MRWAIWQYLLDIALAKLSDGLGFAFGCAIIPGLINRITAIAYCLLCQGTDSSPGTPVSERLSGGKGGG
jgi:hypothetical protein